MTMDLYKQGQADAIVYQAIAPPEALINSTPQERQQFLDEITEDRDRMKKLAAEGDEGADKQARYLDGYLSVWDEGGNK